MSTVPALPRGRQRRRSPWEVQRAVLFALIVRELRMRVGGQWVSALWTVVEPLAHVVVLTLVVAGFRGMSRGDVEFPVFLVIGLVPFFMFQKIVSRLLDGVDANRGLFAYRQVHPLDALTARAVVEGLMSLVVYVFSLGLLAWLGYHVVPARPLEVVLTAMAIWLFGLTAGVLLAVWAHDRPRLRTVIRLSFMPLYLLSGVIFNVDALPRDVVEWLLWNPMMHWVELSRHAFMPAYQPAYGIGWGYPLMWLLGTGALGMLLYRAKRQLLLTTQG